MKMPRLSRYASLATILLFTVLATFAQTTPIKSVSNKQKTALENIVREYILKNPSIIREALEALQTQETKAKQALAAENLKKLSSDIYADKDSPTAGNPKGDVTVVAFLDYNCGYCKMSLPALQMLLTKDSAVKIIYKELPILGPDSLLAAQAALAAKKQGKYEQFHQALLGADQANEETIKSIAKQLGLNYETLAKDMADPKLQEELNRNMRLAAALGIDGTPAYIIGDQIIPGAVDIDSLIKKVSIQRAKLQNPDSVAKSSLTKK